MERAHITNPGVDGPAGSTRALPRSPAETDAPRPIALDHLIQTEERLRRHGAHWRQSFEPLVAEFEATWRQGAAARLRIISGGPS